MKEWAPVRVTEFVEDMITKEVSPVPMPAPDVMGRNGSFFAYLFQTGITSTSSGETYPMSGLMVAVERIPTAPRSNERGCREPLCRLI